MDASPDTSYALLDAGDSRRLERFGGVRVSRPAPGARHPRALPRAAWDAADIVYDPQSGWRGTAPENWRIAFGPAMLNLHLSSQGGLGVFPEHAAVCDRLDRILSGRSGSSSVRALNLFAHTGLLTLRLAALPQTVEVVHVDASPAAIRLARDNAAASGLAEARIRWIPDDALRFIAREIRRGSVYDLIAADPPAFGRDRKSGREWRLERDLPTLLEQASRLLAPDGVLCLTCHSSGWDGERLAEAVRRSAPAFGKVEVVDLALRPESGGASLPTGYSVIANCVPPNRLYR